MLYGDEPVPLTRCLSSPPSRPPLQALGQVGKVLKVYADGDLRVAFGGQTWTFNPACLTGQAVEVDANLMTAENPSESGSKGSEDGPGHAAPRQNPHCSSSKPPCMSPCSPSSASLSLSLSLFPHSSFLFFSIPLSHTLTCPLWQTGANSSGLLSSCHFVWVLFCFVLFCLLFSFLLRFFHFPACYSVGVSSGFAWGGLRT